jgi:hypothetical protein
MTIHGMSSSTTSKIVTTEGDEIAAAARASRRVRRVSRRRSSSDNPGGAWTCLIATARCRRSSVARHTVPIPPLPRASSNR